MKLTIKSKLIGGFAFILILMGISALVALNKISSMNERLNNIVDISAEKVKLGARINQNVIDILRAEKSIILAKSTNEMDKHALFIEATRQDLRNKMIKLRELVDEESKGMLDQFVSNWNEYLEVNKRVRELTRLNSNAMALELSSGKGHELSNKAVELMAAIVDKNDRDMVKDKKTSDINYNDLRGLLIAIFIITIIIGIIASAVTIRAISIPLNKLKKAATEIGKGRLDTVLKVDSGDEIDQLTTSFNMMARDLQKITVSKNYLDNILDNMFDSLIVLSTDFKIKTVNKATLNILGYSKEELLNQPIDILFPKEELAIKDINSLMRDGNKSNTESTYIAKSGKKVDVIFSTSLMKNNFGRLEGIICVAVDVSEHKKMEQVMFQSEKMASIGRLATGIAHEINTPLTNASLIVQELKQATKDEGVVQEIEEADTSIERASNIARELLDFSWQGKTEYIPVDINGSIKSALTLLSYTLKKTTLRQNLSDIPDVMGNPVKIEQIFLNILQNSVEAMPDEGEINISTSCDNGLVKIKISDNGIGIPEKHLPKLFDPFFTTKGIGEGTGLGLSICYGIVTQHSGNMDISSSTGEGTIVAIRFPIAKQ